jgi:hypothetical protein
MVIHELVRELERRGRASVRPQGRDEPEGRAEGVPSQVVRARDKRGAFAVG